MGKSDPPKLSRAEELILGLLIHAGEMYGLEMVEKSDGMLARGSVYVTLERMSEKGLVNSRRENRNPGISGIPRRLYLPTGRGELAYRNWVRRREAMLAILVPAAG